MASGLHRVTSELCGSNSLAQHLRHRSKGCLAVRSALLGSQTLPHVQAEVSVRMHLLCQTKANVMLHAGKLGTSLQLFASIVLQTSVPPTA
eukprot:3029787-Amphidinium_carterae.1